MKIADKAVAYLEFELKSETGEVLDSSSDHGPIAYIHGMGNLVPGLEKALEDKSAGDKIDIKLEPKEGYGIYNEELVQDVPKDYLKEIPDLAVGMELEGETEEGIQIVYVKEIGEDTITIDGNHPLAGKTLEFHVEVVSVREATSEEIEHGHVHGEHGHHH
ncbi:FKBP-type peptidyl-prolyl cis-trans isomerase [Spirochaeta cellobiosiphila]|uniref:FKBP-type peptidyl-prolyl cis-trans isomerase n=1 Tax=Spirochaeta cellobiosiphila TaxID=504483 RepID=UPI0004069EF2|nr:peptidylprolyl isomerase [Spirochaeta cellobiosiphila]